jgi:DNA-directed RNA polymerase subunit omega
VLTHTELGHLTGSPEGITNPPIDDLLEQVS